MNPAACDEPDLLVKIKWLMFFRIFFTIFLLGSTIIVQYGQQLNSMYPPLLFLYGIIAGVFMLSIGYAIQISRAVSLLRFAYLQISLDTVIVSLIIFATGCYSSIFSFLYLLIIVYASLMIFRRGSLYIAALSSIQYGVMLDMEFFGILKSFVPSRSLHSGDISQVMYKVVITMVACFAVSLLSSLLAEQARASRSKLQAMEAHVRRVERLAYMGEMAAGLAHEIKNPLASLTGSIQMLQEEIHCDAGEEKLMRIVLREADRLNAIVTDFLIFAKPPSGNILQIDVAQALTEVLELFQHDTARRRQIHMTADLIPDIHIAIDPTHFHQIIWNLLLNAVEAMPSCGDIHIKMRHISNGDIEISVSDSGHGISAEHIHQIFNPFFTTKPGGTGLGLSIVHRLLESYGGRLDVKSNVNSGTTMTLIFPKNAGKSITGYDAMAGGTDCSGISISGAAGGAV